jgi:hypothetical protein
MRAISLHQPWATLIAIGAKRVETAKYKGPLAIHAAKTFCREAFDDRYISRALVAAGYSTVDSLPLGKIIATCTLDHTFHTGQVYIGPPEIHFGDFSFGRFGWVLTNVVPLEPFSFKGRQRWFDVPDDIIKRASE